MSLSKINASLQGIPTLLGILIKYEGEFPGRSADCFPNRTRISSISLNYLGEILKFFEAFVQRPPRFLARFFIVEILKVYSQIFLKDIRHFSEPFLPVFINILEKIHVFPLKKINFFYCYCCQCFLFIFLFIFCHFFAMFVGIFFEIN